MPPLPPTPPSSSLAWQQWNVGFGGGGGGCGGGGGGGGGVVAPNASHAAVPPPPFLRGKLQALVYDILPSTTAVFSYAIGSRKLSANEQFFCWCSNSSRFVRNNSDNIRRLFYN